jgi:hypothetical protein
MQEQRDEGEVAMHAENDAHLPQYTIGEWSRELRQRSVLLRWRAQHLCARSAQLLHKQAYVAPRTK